MIRRTIWFKGRVQGMGFRPTLYRLAQHHRLTGSVRNVLHGVAIQIQGKENDIESFIEHVPEELPQLSHLEGMHIQPAVVVEGETEFQILSSRTEGNTASRPLPDLATCSACWEEFFAPLDRRYQYAFITCTQCGPRHSIISSAPYDRDNTSMKIYKLCKDCLSEYSDPDNRRFHAQNISCRQCGPRLKLTDHTGSDLCGAEEIIPLTQRLLSEGKIVAVKGLTGFQLLTDAANSNSIARLRMAKARERKPFALMVRNLESAKTLIELDVATQQYLCDASNPIVIATIKNKTGLASNLLFDQANVGIMLPTTPLHHLLFADSMSVMVATSGNPHGEPLCCTAIDAYDRLGDIADVFLIHDREIIHGLDDSLIRVAKQKKIILRSGRGLEPSALTLPHAKVDAVAFGAHLKNALAVSQDQHIYSDSYIGDLESRSRLIKLDTSLDWLTAQFCPTPQLAYCDAHPDYGSTLRAQQSKLPVKQVFHHRAHACAALLDCGINEDALVLAWDGMGLGEDGTLWGGEFFHFTPMTLSRVASIRPWRLPGGLKAVKEPRRVAFGLLQTMAVDTLTLDHLTTQWAWSQSQIKNLQQMLQRQLQSPLCNSIGRLFDAVASLLDLNQVQSFEGEAAMALESLCLQHQDPQLTYPVHWCQDTLETDLRRLDWQPMIEALMIDIQQCTPASDIAWKFHHYLAAATTEIAKKQGVTQVVLSGGCFQNATLVETLADRLFEAGIDTHWPQHTAINDQGLAVGQLASSIFDTM